jgi:hypothetical protein
MAEFYRQFALVSSVLAGFAFTFYGTLLVAAREHRAGAWAAFFAVAASVAFLPVTLGMTFGAVLPPTSRESSAIEFGSDSQIALLSMLFLGGVVFLLGSFGVSGWMRSRRLGIATTSLVLIGAVAVFAALRPFLHVVSTPIITSNQSMQPTAPSRGNFSVLATTPCRGLSLSR